MIHRTRTAVALLVFCLTSGSVSRAAEEDAEVLTDPTSDVALAAGLNGPALVNYLAKLPRTADPGTSFNFGQLIWIDPHDDLVIVTQSAAPAATSPRQLAHRGALVSALQRHVKARD